MFRTVMNAVSFTISSVLYCALGKLTASFLLVSHNKLILCTRLTFQFTNKHENHIHVSQITLSSRLCATAKVYSTNTKHITNATD